jgi:hypothetical protein
MSGATLSRESHTCDFVSISLWESTLTTLTKVSVIRWRPMLQGMAMIKWRDDGKASCPKSNKPGYPIAI